MENINELSNIELEKVAGGNDGLINKKVCSLKTGYLALRSDVYYDDKNILGHLYNGDYVSSTGRICGDYEYVYAECKRDFTYDCPAYNGWGWVNRGYLTNA